MNKTGHGSMGKDPSQDTNGRRSFLNGLWIGLGGLVLAEIIWVVRSFFGLRKSVGASNSTGTIVDAGPVSRYAPNTVTAFPQGRFYLACLADGGFLALSRRCTHLGCTVPWDVEKMQFICPCHASTFDINGAVIQSPAPRPLDRFAVTIENDRIRVAVDSPIRRNAFHPDQVVYK